jgi:hypothetical protein
MYTLCYILMWFNSCTCTAKRAHTWAASMLRVMMRIGPPRLHVYSRLTTSPSSVDGTVYRHLYTLPTVTVCLGCPRFGSLTWSSEFTHVGHTPLQALLQARYSSNDDAPKLNHTVVILLTRVSGMLAPNISVRNTTCTYLYEIKFKL